MNIGSSFFTIIGGSRITDVSYTIYMLRLLYYCSAIEYSDFMHTPIIMWPSQSKRKSDFRMYRGGISAERRYTLCSRDGLMPFLKPILSSYSHKRYKREYPSMCGSPRRSNESSMMISLAKISLGTACDSPLRSISIHAPSLSRLSLKDSTISLPVKLCTRYGVRK